MGEILVNGIRVKELMLKRDIRSMARLARLADLSEATVLSAVNGLKTPDLGTVIKLAAVLECHPYDILTATGFPDPHLAAPASLSFAT